MNLSLRSRIALATFVPLVLFGVAAAALGMRGLRATSEELALQRQTALARVGAAGLASNLRSGVRSLEVTARELGELAGSPERQRALLLDRLAALGSFSAVILLDSQGTPIATLPPGFATAGFPFAEQPWFREARAVQSPVFSGVFHYDPTGLPVAAAAVPVRGGGSFGGVLVGGFSLARPEWARDLNLVSTPGGSVAYLVDGNGSVIYRPGSTVPGESIRSDSELWALVSSGSSGGMVYRPPGAGEEMLVTHSPVGSTGWGFVIEEPWAPVIASILPGQEMMAGLMGLGLVVAFAALAFTLGRAVGPLGALVEEGKRVAAGEAFRPLPEEGPPDLRALLQAVNTMVARLEEQQEGLRRYAAQVLTAQEEERLRLSRELHDGAVQDMVGLSQRLELLQQEMEGGSGPTGERMREIQELARRSALELRRMSNNLRPPVLEDLGLVPALELAVRELQQALPETKAAFEVVGEEVSVPPEMELALFRTCQEALTNVRKHAASSARVNVALVFEGGEVTLVVEDDGPGFHGVAPETLLQQGHLGLAGMAERARLFGGRIEVESAPGEGTSVVLQFPVLTPPNQGSSALTQGSA